jgi:hypothetical protein
MDSTFKKDNTSDEEYVQQYKKIIRMMRISKISSKAKIIIHLKEK